MTETASSSTFVCPIAEPILGGKLHGKALKLLKKAHGAKAVKRGVPEVTKVIRKAKAGGKAPKGIVVFAADIFPVELIAHMPVLCEEADILYAYVNTREELGLAIGSKRPVSVVFVQAPAPGSEDDCPYGEAFEGVKSGLKVVHPYMGEGKAQPAETEEAGEKAEGEKKKKKKEKKEKK